MLNWKVSLGYDLPTNAFILHINDVPFLAMPYQASVILKGPQNITLGVISLNGTEVHSGWTQYKADTVYDWRKQSNLQPTTDIAIIDLRCTSSEVVNSIFEELGHTIDQESGLENLAIEFFDVESTL